MRCARRRGDAGSLTVELVVLTPVLFIVALASLVLGRVSEARQQVVEASRAGAEAAAVVSIDGTAPQAAAAEAVVNLIGRTHTCAHVDIAEYSSHFVAGGSVAVTVTVACQVLLSDLAFPGIPGSTVVRSSASAPLDPYRSAG